MIVVSTNDDDLLRLPGYKTQYIFHRASDFNHVQRNSTGKAEMEGVRSQMVIDPLCNFIGITATFTDQTLTPFSCELDCMNPHIFHPSFANQHFIGILWMIEAVREQNHTHCTSRLRIHNLIKCRRVRCEFFSRKETILHQFLGLMLKNHHDLFTHVKMLIVVIVQVWRGNSETGKNQWSLNESIWTKSQGDIVLLGL